MTKSERLNLKSPSTPQNYKGETIHLKQLTRRRYSFSPGIWDVGLENIKSSLVSNQDAQASLVIRPNTRRRHNEKKNEFATLTQVPSCDYAIKQWADWHRTCLLSSSIRVQCSGSVELSCYISFDKNFLSITYLGTTLTKDSNIYKISGPGPYWSYLILCGSQAAKWVFSSY